jgi:translation initiation factor 3 subunit E
MTPPARKRALRAWLTPPPPPQDPHLSLAVVSNFIKELKIYDDTSILELEFSLASKTKLASYAVDTYRQLHGDAAVPPALLAAEAAVMTDLNAQLAACGPLVAIVGLDEPTAQLAELRKNGLFRTEYMREVFGVQEEHVAALLRAAKFRYDVGLYRGGLAYLDLYEELCFPKSDDVPIDIFWGKFAAAMMDEDPMWEKADDERMAIADAIRRRPIADIQRLQQRAWLLHWSLFILANYPKRREALIEFFMLEENLNTITLTCPWLLRYVIAAVLPHRKKHFYAKALCRCAGGGRRALARACARPA